ncbi:MAG TPA: cell wall-binding repeat-containing protein [Candidatus Limnocylindria bacterium]
MRTRIAALGLAVLVTAASPMVAWADDPAATLPPPPQLLQPGVHGEALLDDPGLPGGLVADTQIGKAAVEPLALTGTTAEATGGVGTLAETAVAAGRLPNGLTREVFGYLPYWELGSADLAALRYDLVSSIAYFGVAARGDGTLARTSSGVNTAGWSGWTSTALTNVVNSAHQRGVKVVLTVTLMSWSGDYTTLSMLLNSASNRQRLIGEIASVLKARGADGVNLDFEPVPTSLKAAFTQFVREVKAGLPALGAGSYVTVATMAGAASWATGYDLVGLTAAGAADAIMVMGYDLSWGGSARAGGVAPISNPYILDVNEAINAHLALGVPPTKMIWGVPYYGRVWPTQTDQLNSLACANASVCPSSKIFSPGAVYEPTYIGARDLAAQYGRRWDSAGQVPYVAWYDAANTTWRQAYYDDAASLGAKYDLIRLKGLAGAGIWALGMDTGSADLWNVIVAKFVRRDSRLAGADRYATAAATSAYGFPTGAPVAYVATGENFPDALAGAVLAAREGGPMLLVKRDELPATTAAELSRLRPERIVLLGGTGVIGDAVAAALAPYASSGVVQRLAGASRYDTAAAASAAGFPSGAGVAYLVTGANYPDALAGGVLAARSGGPILLVRSNEIPAVTAAELARLHPSRIVIIGGAGVVSDGVRAAAARYASSGVVDRLAGADRYATAVAVSQAAFGGAVPSAFMATGAGFADALAGVPVAARAGSPLLLTGTWSLPASTGTELYRLNPPALLVLGGTGAISEQVVWAMHEALR